MNVNVVNVVKQSLSSDGKCFGKTSIFVFAERVFSRLSLFGIQKALIESIESFWLIYVYIT